MCLLVLGEIGWYKSSKHISKNKLDLFLSVVIQFPNLGQNAEKRFIPNTTIHRWFTFMGEKKVLLLLEILQNWVDILERLVDFCSHLHNGAITCMCDMKE